jgi:hypothetical protein
MDELLRLFALEIAMRRSRHVQGHAPVDSAVGRADATRNY